jgi:hypothetical protein
VSEHASERALKEALMHIQTRGCENAPVSEVKARIPMPLPFRPHLQTNGHRGTTAVSSYRIAVRDILAAKKQWPTEQTALKLKWSKIAKSTKVASLIVNPGQVGDLREVQPKFDDKSTCNSSLKLGKGLLLTKHRCKQRTGRQDCHKFEKSPSGNRLKA